MDPYFGEAAGAIREMTPQLNWAGMLDGAQAASGLMMLEQVSGNPDYLRRATAFCDYLLKNFSPEKGLPWKATFEPEVRIDYNDDQLCMAQCTAIPLWHLYKRTGEKKYLPPLLWAADFILGCQQPDGSLIYRQNPEDAPLPPANHHEGRGEGKERYTLWNDDGSVVVLLSAYMASDDEKYLESVKKYADWILKNGPVQRPFCSFPVQASNLLDIGKVTGDDYSEWVLDSLKEHLLDLQVRDTGDPVADGGFRGEDEEDEGGIFGGTSLDYVTTRMTCYCSGLLFRLSGKGTGSGFSPFGLPEQS